MASCVGIERRDPDKPVDPCFALEVAECIGTGDLDRHALVSAFILESVEDFGLELVALAPSEVHPHEHRSPVAGFGSARSGVDGKEDVSLVVFAVEKGLELQGPVFVLEGKDPLVDFPCILFVSVVFLFIEFDEVICLVDVGKELLEGNDCILDCVYLREYGICFLFGAPEIGF